MELTAQCSHDVVPIIRSVMEIMKQIQSLGLNVQRILAYNITV